MPRRLIHIVIIINITFFLIICTQCKNDISGISSENTDKTSLDTMVFINSNGKSFQMGSNTGENIEKPIHTVKFTYDFYIGKTEVTQREYQELMGENPSVFIGDNQPVENLSWFDAIKFCNKKSLKDGLTPCYNIETGECNFKNNGYRLPTEAEWEYAARGGSESKGYEFSGSDSIGEVAWYSNNSEDKSHPVGEKSPNELNIYDMSGNVLEWCNDWYDERYYEQCKIEGAILNTKGPLYGEARALRGGCWSNIAKTCRSAYRFGFLPENRYSFIGFRLARGQINKD